MQHHFLVRQYEIDIGIVQHHFLVRQYEHFVKYLFIDKSLRLNEELPTAVTKHCQHNNHVTNPIMFSILGHANNNLISISIIIVN